MPSVEHFILRLTEVSDARLHDLQSITVRGPNRFEANVFTLKLRSLVHQERVWRGTAKAA